MMKTTTPLLGLFITSSASSVDKNYRKSVEEVAVSKESMTIHRFICNAIPNSYFCTCDNYNMYRPTQPHSYGRRHMIDPLDAQQIMQIFPTSLGVKANYAVVISFKNGKKLPKHLRAV